MSPKSNSKLRIQARLYQEKISDLIHGYNSSYLSSCDYVEDEKLQEKGNDPDNINSKITKYSKKDANISVPFVPLTPDSWFLTHKIANSQAYKICLPIIAVVGVLVDYVQTCQFNEEYSIGALFEVMVLLWVLLVECCRFDQNVCKLILSKFESWFLFVQGIVGSGCYVIMWGNLTECGETQILSKDRDFHYYIKIVKWVILFQTLICFGIFLDAAVLYSRKFRGLIQSLIALFLFLIGPIPVVLFGTTLPQSDVCFGGYCFSARSLAFEVVFTCNIFFLKHLWSTIKGGRTALLVANLVLKVKEIPQSDSNSVELPPVNASSIISIEIDS